MPWTLKATIVTAVAFGAFTASFDPAYGQTMPDPAQNQPDRAVGNQNSDATPADIDLEGTLELLTFTGPTTGRQMPYALYLPKGYHETDRRFPVMYFLHGAGTARRAELQDGYGLFQAVFYDRAIASGTIPPMIIAMPVTQGVSLWADAKDGSTLAATQFIEEFVPYMDQTYRTVAERNGRIVEGFSMGGNGAVLFGAKHPELFSAVISIDGAVHEWVTLGDYQRADIAAETFGGDEAYFQRYSPDHLMVENAELIREHGLDFIFVVGQLKSYNERLREVMESEQISLRYTDTTFRHEMGKLRRHDRDAIFSLVNKYFATAGE
ncbi:MAG: alpha/beta hydrolase-fold protein [Planctomycetota bacterium]